MYKSQNIENFIFVGVLNRRQIYWNMSLSCFGFVIIYWPTEQQRLSNALSWRSYLVLKEGEAGYD